MKCLRLFLPTLILLAAGVLAELVAGPEENAQRPPLRLSERMLLGSLVGLTICVLWIWISRRAGR